MNGTPQRDVIEEGFQNLDKAVAKERKETREALEALARSDADSKNPEEANRIIYNAALLEKYHELVRLDMLQAEYCDFYISKNEECHKAHLESFKVIREEIKADIEKINKEIKPFIDTKRDVEGVFNLSKMLKKTPLKLVEWGAIIALLFHWDSIPK